MNVGNIYQPRGLKENFVRQDLVTLGDAIIRKLHMQTTDVHALAKKAAS